MYVCTSMLWINIKQNKVIERNISGERSSQNTQLSLERKEGLIVFSPLQFIVLPPGTLRGVCPCLWSRGPVPLLLRHCGDWDHRDRAWIWWTGWRRLALFPPAFPRSSALLGWKLALQFFPLSESTLICSSFLSFYSEWPACCRGRWSGAGCWAEQPQLCSISSFKECHFSYSPGSESELEWCFWAEDGSVDKMCQMCLNGSCTL